MVLVNDSFAELPRLFIELMCRAVRERETRRWQCVGGGARIRFLAERKGLKARVELGFAIEEDGANLLRIALVPSQLEVLKDVLIRDKEGRGGR